MSQMIAVFVPLLAFMLIPVWIPLAAIAIGKMGDVLGVGGKDPVAQRIEQLKAARRTASADLAHVD